MKWIAPALVYIAVIIGLFAVRNALGALILFHVAIVASVLVTKSRVPINILVTSHDIKWILISVLLCGSTGFTLYSLWDKFGIASDLSKYVEEMGLTQSAWFWFIGYFTLANPWIEEYFWRGFLGSTTKNIYLSDFLYAGFHGLILMNRAQANMIVYSLVLLILAGWFWRQIARLDQGLLAPVLGHMAADFSILMAVYLRSRG